MHSKDFIKYKNRGAAIHKGEGITELPGNLSKADQLLRDIKKHLEITSLVHVILT